MSTSFQNLIDEYITTGHLYSIPRQEGTYKVIVPKDFEVCIKADSDALQSTKIPYSIALLSEKWEKICKISNEDKKIVYIGKANDLRQRTLQFIRFRMGQVQNHAGGRALWQIENNMQLLFEYTVGANSREKEKAMLMTYKDKYGVYPFANFKS